MAARRDGCLIIVDYRVMSANGPDARRMSPVAPRRLHAHSLLKHFINNCSYSRSILKDTIRQLMAVYLLLLTTISSDF